MKTKEIYVSSCGDCPFEWPAQEGEWCSHDDYRGTDMVTDHTKTLSGCPLKQSNYTIKLFKL